LPWKYVQTLHAQIDKLAADAGSCAKLMVVVMLLCSGAILLIMFNSYLVINVAIRHLIERTRDIAEGDSDLTKRLNARKNTELDELTHWFNQFMSRL